MSEETTQEQELAAEEVLAGANQAMKDRWLAILIQLNNSKRFQKFVADNYTIGDHIDDEKKVIETVVIEKPTAVGPSLTGQQVAKITQSLIAAQAKDPANLTKKILAILGQDDTPVIFSGSELSDTLHQESLKQKLD